MNILCKTSGDGKMLITGNRVISNNIFSSLVVNKNARKFGTSTLAQKRDFSESQQQPPIFPLRVSNTILARSAVAVFALGFIDAG